MGGRGANAIERKNYNQMLEIRKIAGAEYEVYRAKGIKGIEQISIFQGTREPFNSERMREINKVLVGDDYGDWRKTTQDALNKAPVAIWTHNEPHSYYIFPSKAAMDKVIRQVYGGYSQLGKMGKDFTIMSASGTGEYYLKYDKWAKGQYTWQDTNGMTVEGRERRKIRGID